LITHRELTNKITGYFHRSLYSSLQINIFVMLFEWRGFTPSESSVKSWL